MHDGSRLLHGSEDRVSSAKGLCEPRRIPCVGVSALEAASYTAAGTDGICVPVTDARRGNVYAAAFDVRGEKPVRLFEDTIIPIGELCALLGQYGQTVYFVGDAAEALSRAAHECGLHSPALSPCMRISQTASGACFAAIDAWKCASDKEKFEAKYLSPVYLRDGRISNPGGEK